MNSIIEEIKKMRNGETLTIDRHNSNRYRIVTMEADGSKTAYCFSVPIYNIKSKKLVDLSFTHDNSTSYALGSNAEISISNCITLANDDGLCRISLPEFYSSRDTKNIHFKGLDVLPTLNGVAIKADCSSGMPYKFELTAGHPFMNARANNKYFSLMCEEYKPFITVSCIGTLDARGRVIAPASVRYQKLSDRDYSIEVSPYSPSGWYVMLEINMFEPKLFQDTTVESADPKSNNSFGGTAFIGNTSLYGEQWLYTRPDISRISENINKRTSKAILHLPQLNQSKTLLSASRIYNRFCSFGANWNVKVRPGETISSSVSENGYQSIDVTDIMVNSNSKYIIRSEGLILRTKVKDSGFSVISTGDSYFAPQILELSFR